jgi:hypothetical protein
MSPAGLAEFVPLEESRLRHFLRNAGAIAGSKKRGFCRRRWRVAAPGLI